MGFAFALIAAFALIGMMSSVIIADTLRGEATAINRAGALRMQTYAIGIELLTPRPPGDASSGERIERSLQRFENQLHSEVLMHILPRRPSDPVRVAYDEITQSWETRIRPAFALAANAPLDADEFVRLEQHMHAFVHWIDTFVRLLEQKTERKVQLLRFTQGAFLFLTLVVIFVTMYLFRNDVLQPLRELLRATDAVRQRDFSWRVEHTGPDELGRLGTTFNRMAEELSQSYEDLEARVQDKTAVLERTNLSLDLMYRSLSQLHDTDVSGSSYTRTLRDLETFLDVGPGSICVVDEDTHKGYRIAQSESGSISGLERCILESCEDCLDRAQTSIRYRAQGKAMLQERLLNTPLHDGSRLVGLLTLEIPADQPLEPWQIQLVEGVAKHLGIAMGRQRRLEQFHRLALLEERATIARELHDSLAQGLTYLKILASRLQGMLGQPGRVTQANETIRELRESLNDTYRELRELLTTFRIRMDTGGLHKTLESSVREFAERGHLKIGLTNRVADGELGANAEIHVLQIVREALSNVVKHAEASAATVALAPLPDGRIRITVEDDGRGMPSETNRHGHYGLTIMQERAHKLNADLRIRPGEGGGTRIDIDVRAPTRIDPTVETPTANRGDLWHDAQ
jgi:two-component system nitrate/nitrite sensor histidine kinase NarX